MKSLFLTLVVAFITSTSSAQMLIIDGRIENTKGKTRVVLYEYSGTKWDTAYVGNFRKHYSLVLDRDYSYQIWFINATDSVKVLAVDREAISAREIIVDVNFSRKECARVIKGKGNRPFDLRLVECRMTITNKPEDFDKATN